MRTPFRAIQEPRIKTDPEVLEGGVIVVKVADDVSHVLFYPAGHQVVKVRVVNGLAEFRLPPEVRGGTEVSISDGKYPNPSSTGVLVVGAQSS